MKAIIGWVKAEPVRAFVAAQALVSWLVAGLGVFDVWHPTVEQLSWVTGSVATIAAAFGFTVVRGAVTPESSAQERIGIAYDAGKASTYQ